MTILATEDVDTENVFVNECWKYECIWMKYVLKVYLLGIHKTYNTVLNYIYNGAIDNDFFDDNDQNKKNICSLP